MTVIERIRELCKENNISITILEQKLGFSNGSITKPKVIPSDRLLKIAQYFNVSMEYLLGATCPSGDYLTSDERNLIIEYRNSDDVSRDMIRRTLAYAKAIKNNTNKQSND